MNEILTYQEAAEIFAELQAHADMSDPDIAEMYHDLYKGAARYANFRAKWNTLTREQKMDEDGYRTSAHNHFIALIDIIARNQGEDGAKWRERLGADDRKRVGDFACYLALFRGLEAR